MSKDNSFRDVCAAVDSINTVLARPLTFDCIRHPEIPGRALWRFRAVDDEEVIFKFSSAREAMEAMIFARELIERFLTR